MARFHSEVYSNPDHPTGLNKVPPLPSFHFLNSHIGDKQGIDLHGIAQKYEEELNRFEDLTAVQFREAFDPEDLGSAFRCKLLPFLANYSRLVMFSFGFQRVFTEGGLKAGDVFLTRVSPIKMGLVRDGC